MNPKVSYLGAVQKARTVYPSRQEVPFPIVGEHFTEFVYERAVQPRYVGDPKFFRTRVVVEAPDCSVAAFNEYRKMMIEKGFAMILPRDRYAAEDAERYLNFIISGVLTKEEEFKTPVNLGPAEKVTVLNNERERLGEIFIDLFLYGYGGELEHVPFP